MPLRVSGIRLPIDAPSEALREAVGRRAGLQDEEISSIEVRRRSIDRRHHQLVVEYVVELELRDETAFRASGRVRPGVEHLEIVVPPEERRGEDPLRSRPVIIGAGPAGLFAALHLAQRDFRPVILERGDAMNLRTRRISEINHQGILDPESNYLYGEGGAGTFSDGKLTSRSKDPRSAEVLREFRDRSGVDSVTYDYRPHLGSDRVRAVVGRLRREILALGGEFHWRTKVTGLRSSNGRVSGVTTDGGEIEAAVVILGAGHSARDLLRVLHAEGVRMERKPFQLGLRVEHPQVFIDRAIYGHHAGDPRFGPADYRLAVSVRGASVFSFCMCPGGEIIPAVADPRFMNTNGMSWSSKATGFANSGIVTTLEPESFPGEGVLAGVELQERYEALAMERTGGTLAVPSQLLVDFLAGRPSPLIPSTSCRTGTVPLMLAELVPPGVRDVLESGLRSMDRQLSGFLQADAVLVGPESRSSSPVRVLRSATTFEAPGFEGLYPVGEGAGYAGGIISAAVDGRRAAEAVAARYRPQLVPG